MGYSLFVDAAYNNLKFEYATSFFISNTEGKIWAAGYQRISPPGSVLAAELKDILKGITF